MFFYYPLKKVEYKASKKINCYLIKKFGPFLKITNNIKEEKGEIFDIFVKKFQEELY